MALLDSERTCKCVAAVAMAAVCSSGEFFFSFLLE